jgi:hypothetical protein
MKGWVIFIIIVLICGYLYYFRPDTLNIISGKITDINGTTFGTTNVKNVLNNPKNYEGKTVKVQGKFFSNSWPGGPFIENDQGYEIKLTNLEKNRNYYDMHNYEVTGRIRLTENCKCVNKYTSMVKGNDLVIGSPDMEVPECRTLHEKYENIDCDPNSIQLKEVYIEVTEMTRID